ncbi:hypothetical protein bcere0009_34480 [Bacillus cereus R309803]|nr:hypothetical protein bcere0009_34480 [Bacillus cereus R309803]
MRIDAYKSLVHTLQQNILYLYAIMHIHLQTIKKSLQFKK